MKKFADDLFSWAHGIFKKAPRRSDMDMSKLADATGKLLDDAKLIAFRVRELKFIATAEGAALDLHGIDRKMPRLAGETDASYRRRLLAAYDLYREGGTKAGMKRVLESLGYLEAEVYPLYREKYKFHFHDGTLRMDGEHNMKAKDDSAHVEYLAKWSQFIIYLNASDDALMQRDRERLLYMINKAKPIESKLYAFLFSFAARTAFYLRHTGYSLIRSPAYLLNRPGGYLMNGRRVMDGTTNMGNAFAKGYALVRSEARTSRQVHPLHDGKHRMNGRLTMNEQDHVLHSASAKVKTEAVSDLAASHRQTAAKFASAVRQPYHSPCMDEALHMDGQRHMREDGIVYTLRSVFQTASDGGAFGRMGEDIQYMDGGGHLRRMDGANRMANDLLLDGTAHMNGQRLMRPIATHLAYCEPMDSRRLMGGSWRMDGKTGMRGVAVRHNNVALIVRRNDYIVERRAIS